MGDELAALLKRKRELLSELVLLDMEIDRLDGKHPRPRIVCDPSAVGEIDSLGLTVRTRNALWNWRDTPEEKQQRKSITYYVDLYNSNTIDKLLTRKGFGEISLSELIGRLREKGYIK